MVPLSIAKGLWCAGGADVPPVLSSQQTDDLALQCAFQKLVACILITFLRHLLTIPAERAYAQLARYPKLTAPCKHSQIPPPPIFKSLQVYPYHSHSQCEMVPEGTSPLTSPRSPKQLRLALLLRMFLQLMSRCLWTHLFHLKSLQNR